MTELTAVPTYPDEYVPAILAQWSAARELHAPTHVDALSGDCATEDCEHEEECPTQSVLVCGHCYSIAEEHGYETVLSDDVAWPCETAKALGATA